MNIACSLQLHSTRAQTVSVSRWHVFEEFGDDSTPSIHISSPLARVMRETISAILVSYMGKDDMKDDLGARFLEGKNMEFPTTWSKVAGLIMFGALFLAKVFVNM